MSISFLPPLPPIEGWEDHLRELKRCRGATCYGALMAHFGTESPALLEWRVDRRPPYATNDDTSSSNKYRRWRQGRALPGDDTIPHVAKRSAGAVRLDIWRDLPLWELLHPEPPTIRRLHELLEQSPEWIRRILFGHPDIERRFNHSILEREQVLAIRNFQSLDAFIALLCLSRKGEILEDDPRHYFPALCAFDILPRVLYANRPLRYRWEELFACIERIYWRREYSTRATFRFPIERIRSALDRLDADPSSVLPMYSGRRDRDVDTNESKRVDFAKRR